MIAKKVKNVRILRNILLGITTLLIIGGAVFYDLLLNEDRDYRLYDQLRLLAIDIEQYKKDNGHYPTDINAFGRGNKLCVYELYKKCSDIKYKPNPDLSSYKIAARSFNGLILYYDPTNYGLNDGRRSRVCYFCAAYPESDSKHDKSSNTTPIYRQNQEEFPNPADWPEI